MLLVIDSSLIPYRDVMLINPSGQVLCGYHLVQRGRGRSQSDRSVNWVRQLPPGSFGHLDPLIVYAQRVDEALRLLDTPRIKYPLVAKERDAPLVESLSLPSRLEVW
jgi:hypothetical protein